MPTSNWTDVNFRRRSLDGYPARPLEEAVFGAPAAPASSPRAAAAPVRPVIEPLEELIQTEQAVTPAYARQAPKSRSRMILMAAPVALATLAVVGFMVLSGGDTGAPAAESSPGNGALVATSAGSQEQLVGMTVSDTTTLNAADETISPPAVSAEPRAEPTPRVEQRQDNAEAVRTPAAEEASAPPVLEAASPPVSALPGEPLIETEPLAVQ